jgi:hypothetical protein
VTGISNGIRAGRRRGFSLILVLLITILGTAMLGGLLAMSEKFAALSGASMRSEETYNILQEEVEKGKAVLKQAMSGAAVPLRKRGGIVINTLDALLVYDGASPLCDISRNVLVAGRNAELKVGIYDMGYEASELPAQPGAEFLASLPQSFTLTAQTELSDGSVLGIDSKDDMAASLAGSANAGAYVIRATITYADGTSRTIETAVLQAVG